MRMRLSQLRDDPALQPWLLRAVVLRSEGRVIGHIGFHNAPDSADLREVAPGGVELGYTVYPEFRRRRFAFEACVCLMGWARRAHGVSRFVASISPENAPSLALARKLGFVKVGTQWDEEDGPEDVFLLETGIT
jgi:RimJ/RimL family protein N-acetyltransferase